MPGGFIVVVLHGVRSGVRNLLTRVQGKHGVLRLGDTGTDSKVSNHAAFGEGFANLDRLGDVPDRGILALDAVELEAVAGVAG